MESPPDPTSEPGNSAPESATPARESPVNLETLRKADLQAPVRRQSCSSTNRGLFSITTCGEGGEERSHLNLKPDPISSTEPSL
ncbi:nuclear receptor ROR-alpha-like [Brachyhypopomus gauderio]|uniref:nuclear receptor ROR-alpha-like n=1 Tax=Brachyhypopomus gauderio TaxID=698409 RepID=UPI0040414897